MLKRRCVAVSRYKNAGIRNNTVHPCVCVFVRLGQTRALRLTKCYIFIIGTGVNTVFFNFGCSLLFENVSEGTLWMTVVAWKTHVGHIDVS